MILEEARVVPIAMVMGRRRLRYFEQVKRDEAENIRAVAQKKMEGSALGEDRSCGGNTLSEGT